MNLQKFIAYLAAAFFFVYGLAFSLVPNAMSVAVTGSELSGTSAIIDYRATYGGMTIAVGLIIAYLHAIGQNRASLIVIIIVLLSMAATRTIGFVLDGTGNVFMYLYLLLEIGGSLLALFALRRD